MLYWKGKAPNKRRGGERKDEWVEKKRKCVLPALLVDPSAVTDQIVENPPPPPPIKQSRYRDPNNLVWFSKFFFFFSFSFLSLFSAKVRCR